MAVKVNPRILEWARVEAGFSTEEISEYLEIEERRYLDWENNGDGIPLGMLEKISDKYKRQLAVFLLPNVPPKMKKPSDFRNIRLSEIGISKETLLAIRRSRRYLDLSYSLIDKDSFNSKYTLFSKIRTPSELREILGISVKDQFGFDDARIAFNSWRKSLEEKLGIFIFQFSMPPLEVQAFCLADDKPFGIVLNSKCSHQSRIFSIFHEFAHILKSQSGICFYDDLENNKYSDIEIDCNMFAGKLLVPDDAVPKASNMEELTRYANRLKVSKEVILRRNLERSYINKDKFFELLRELKSIPFKSSKSGPISPIVKSKSSRGLLFFDLIFDAVKRERIDYNTASDALDLKLYHLIYA